MILLFLHRRSNRLLKKFILGFFSIRQVKKSSLMSFYPSISSIVHPGSIAVRSFCPTLHRPWWPRIIGSFHNVKCRSNNCARHIIVSAYFGITHPQ